MLKDATIQMLGEYRIRLDPALDEQQLVDPFAIRALVREAEIEGADTVLEVGAGAGNITVQLAAQAGMVIAVEKNPKFMKLLEDRTEKLGNVQVINDDALTMALPRFTKLVSNLPYGICEALLRRLIRHGFERASLIVSSTFAEIVMAARGSPRYSRLTLTSNLFYEVVGVAVVKPESYYPPPSVSTCMVTLEPRDPEDHAGDVLRRVLFREGMKLRNALREALIASSPRYGGPTTKRGARGLISMMGMEDALLERRVARLSLEDLEETSRRMEPHLD